MSACDDLKEADISLEKRKQTLEELERELREYNLKSFISTGFNDKRELPPRANVFKLKLAPGINMWFGYILMMGKRQTF